MDWTVDTHLEFLNIWVERNAEQDAVLCDKDEVEQELSHESWDMLQRFGPRQQQRVHPAQHQSKGYRINQSQVPLQQLDFM